jgi:hypothetical protein
MPCLLSSLGQLLALRCFRLYCRTILLDAEGLGSPSDLVEDFGLIVVDSTIARWLGGREGYDYCILVELVFAYCWCKMFFGLVSVYSWRFGCRKIVDDEHGSSQSRSWQSKPKRTPFSQDICILIVILLLIEVRGIRSRFEASYKIFVLQHARQAVQTSHCILRLNKIDFKNTVIHDDVRNFRHHAERAFYPINSVLL